MSTHSTAGHRAMGHGTPKDAGISVAGWLAILTGVVITGFLIYQSLAHPSHASAHGPLSIPTAWQFGIVPFIAILGCIAILPLLPFTHHWWESNINRLAVSLSLAVVTLLYYVLTQGAASVVSVLEHAIVIEYIPFIVLLFSLYVISGGISIRGDLAAHPGTNTAMLAIGAGIASFIGTTGASMLLIRPLLQTNSERKHVMHTVIFFIFLVSNIGGTLLPIGDPPLFLGFLRGVPFLWTLTLFAPWIFTCVILLVVYFIWDSIAYRKEDPKDIRRDETQKRPLRISGMINILWLLGVVAAVGTLTPGKVIFGFTVFPFLREILMLAFVAASLFTTPKGVREYNRFNYVAILEVAALFVGIFITMQVPLAVLKACGADITSVVNQPWQYFWSTGSLSSVLDNAPTYLVFFELAGTAPESSNMLRLTGGGHIDVSLLRAISLGAVFMGAMTYIGNGPNFMVKAIAEQSGIKMPSFFGFLFKFAVPILVPVFIVVTLLFVRG
jgi:Na+/H+ antiporter NhaD/arsenite permease-like protein